MTFTDSSDSEPESESESESASLSDFDFFCCPARFFALLCSLAKLFARMLSEPFFAALRAIALASFRTVRFVNGRFSSFFSAPACSFLRMRQSCVVCVPLRPHRLQKRCLSFSPRSRFDPPPPVYAVFVFLFPFFFLFSPSSSGPKFRSIASHSSMRRALVSRVGM